MAKLKQKQQYLNLEVENAINDIYQRQTMMPYLSLSYLLLKSLGSESYQTFSLSGA